MVYFPHDGRPFPGQITVCRGSLLPAFQSSELVKCQLDKSPLTPLSKSLWQCWIFELPVRLDSVQTLETSQHNICASVRGKYTPPVAGISWKSTKLMLFFNEWTDFITLRSTLEQKEICSLASLVRSKRKVSAKLVVWISAVDNWWNTRHRKKILS